jgi:Ca2+-binding EF-hand superfamily protein
MYTALIQGVDADSDGRLSFEEFCDMMTSKERVGG